MAARFRIVLASSYALAATLLLVPLQVISMKTGLWRETFILKIWHRAILRALGIRVRVTGAPVQNRPLLIAANHISWTDIPALGAIADVCFIAKADMQGWPLVGFLSSLQRTVYVEREQRRKSGDQAGEIAKRLVKGQAMVLFAEGTTGDGNLLLPFKSTLFGAATMAVAEGVVDEVAIQPVAIAYTRLHGMPLGRRFRPLVSWIGDQDLGPHARLLLETGALDVEISFGEPVMFRAGDNRKQIARQVEERVEALFFASLHLPLSKAMD
ncbi:lysophospholipid acyltransferase family protein [Aquamicrobium segne]|uniref:Lysophospholipid acyltransferase family protein n=1 Tax=Aquamicrobium segne TaxID=469547 RepID=A0ABW0GVF8_9HYPH